MANARIAVIGAGLMGHGIAQVFALAGHDVTIYDAIQASLDTVKARIGANLRDLGDDETAEHEPKRPGGETGKHHVGWCNREYHREQEEEQPDEVLGQRTQRPQTDDEQAQRSGVHGLGRVTGRRRKEEDQRCGGYNGSGANGQYGVLHARRCDCGAA